MSTASLGGMDRRRAEIARLAIPAHWINHVDLRRHDHLAEELVTALVEGRSFNIYFDNDPLGITLIAVMVDELRQPVFTVHVAEFAVSEELTALLNQRVRRSLLETRRFHDEEMFDLLWELQCFLREHDEEGHDIDVRFTISVIMAWCRLEQFQHNELHHWKRMIFGRFDDDVDYPLVKLISLDDTFDEEASKALNNRLRTAVEF